MAHVALSEKEFEQKREIMKDWKALLRGPFRSYARSQAPAWERMPCRLPLAGHAPETGASETGFPSRSLGTSVVPEK